MTGVDAVPGLILVGAPRVAYGNIFFPPVNATSQLVIALLSESRGKRDNFSPGHLDKLEEIGFTVECVFPGQDRGIDWRETL